MAVLLYVLAAIIIDQFVESFDEVEVAWQYSVGPVEHYSNVYGTDLIRVRLSRGTLIWRKP